jgi:hypothetical protein
MDVHTLQRKCIAANQAGWHRLAAGVCPQPRVDERGGLELIAVNSDPTVVRHHGILAVGLKSCMVETMM